MSLLGRFVDERFLEHRRWSMSWAGLVGGYVAVGLFAWHYYVDHVFSWDLLAVALAIAVVKTALMAWSFATT